MPQNPQFWAPLGPRAPPHCGVCGVSSYATGARVAICRVRQHDVGLDEVVVGWLNDDTAVITVYDTRGRIYHRGIRFCRGPVRLRISHLLQ